MSAFLPHRDPDPDQRAADLQEAQDEFQYNYTYVSPLAMVDKVPFQDAFAWHWMVHCGQHALTMLANHIEVDGDPRRKDEHRERHSRFFNLINAVSADFRGVIDVIEEALGASPISGRLESLEEFNNLFRRIGLPPINKDYTDNRVFAETRLAGPNPVMLRRVTRLDDRFPVTDQLLHGVLDGDSLDAAGAEGRMYLADYAMLKGMENGSFPNTQKYVYAPLALFIADKASGRLKPTAIQCTQEPGPDSPIFTPDDQYGWVIAKTIVEVADGNYHEAVSHLGRTHLFIEPFVVATYRQLAASHPIAILLQPHFEGTLRINEFARRDLIKDRGPVDQMLGGSITATRALTVNGVLNYSFNESMLPFDLASRGVDDLTLLPNYPYRDDSLLYWTAIRKWVSDYLALYYQSDADLHADQELAAWFRELSSASGGRVKGLGRPDGVTRSYLVDVISHIIFTSSVQHAAVNFPQYDVMSYVPYMPLAGYQPAPTRKEGLTLADYLAMLPPAETALLQVHLGYFLGSVHYTTLGKYPIWHFPDHRVNGPQAEFVSALDGIGKTIEVRNAHRRPYNTLAPSGIPQSINI